MKAKKFQAACVCKPVLAADDIRVFFLYTSFLFLRVSSTCQWKKMEGLGISIDAASALLQLEDSQPILCVIL